MLEKDIEFKVVAYSFKLDYLQFKLNLQGNKGWPDRLFINSRGLDVFVEFKMWEVLPYPLQCHRIMLLRQTGKLVFVCDDVEVGKAILERFKDEDPYDPSFQRVVTEILSKQGYSPDASAGRRRFILRPGIGKNIDRSCSLQDIEV